MLALPFRLRPFRRRGPAHELHHDFPTYFATHYAWLPTNRWGLKNLANLGNRPATGATLIVGAPNWRGGLGGPSRVMALV